MIKSKFSKHFNCLHFTCKDGYFSPGKFCVSIYIIRNVYPVYNFRAMV